MTSLILQDRDNANKYALSIADGELRWEITAEAAQSEPILFDGVKHWKIFFSYGELYWEETATVQSDTILLYDSILFATFSLTIEDGELDWHSFDVGEKLFQELTNINRLYQELSNGNRIIQELCNL